MSSTRPLIAWLALSLAACASHAPASAPSASSAPSTSSASSTSSTAGPRKPTGAPPASAPRAPTCAAPAYQVRDVAIALRGQTLSFHRDRGGGCAKRPSYTLAVGAGDPLPVAVCYDPEADTCEMYIAKEPVTLALGPALQAAGATSAVLAR